MRRLPASLREFALLIIFLGVLAYAASAQTRPPEVAAAPTFSAEPIRAFGHGIFIAADGKAIAPDRAFIQAAQKYYVDNLQRLRGTTDTTRVRTLITQAVTEEPVANALFINWLLEELHPPRRAQLRAINNALHQRYLKLLGRALPGVDGATVAKLKRDGITVMMATTQGGTDYLQECASNGVPVPLAVLGAGWIDRGDIPGAFLATSGETRLWQFGGPSPIGGMCLAVTHSGSSSDTYDDLALTCHGTLTDKACFWYSDDPVPAGTALVDMVGGADLSGSSVEGGVCSDCHAGENPFVVHPTRAAFAALWPVTNNDDWYEPIVAADWPQNPGPTNALEAVSSTERCDSCHQRGLAGRFPEPSSDLWGWCATVLGKAVSPVTPNSMPPGGNYPPYKAHIDELLLRCQYPYSDGHIVGAHFEDDVKVVSPPSIVDPLFACATAVSVKGGIYGATLRLYLNGVLVGTKIAHDPGSEDFNLPALVIGNVLNATQEFGGVLSKNSVAVTVQDHLAIYPEGLPPPDIDPSAIYQCATVAGVRNVPGAIITLYVNAAFPSTRSTSTDWSRVTSGKGPFGPNDSLFAVQQLCSDVSKRSRTVKISPPPGGQAAQFEPGVIYGGQQLLEMTHMRNGAFSVIRETNTSTSLAFTTPVSHKENIDFAAALGRPFQVGDQVQGTYEVCPRQSSGATQVHTVESCNNLWPPKLATPHAGDTSVKNLPGFAAPGARIRVYDAANKEIGDGSGQVINLTRALTAADVITAVQQLANCTSQAGWQTGVQ